ncbi:TetR/AcrR family transcriptional regulator [Leucobacter sp. UT-8R-CII-1-4]|uniref:TetR/AcrR family transcriptional regulator n=1 Tax=Leucobacter sp. UT-8R-CII-1-4 TaxID=3040075 RepID=UPI0024A94186|nr:TetR/AcrR family transcriptional regulator [Leucobacter sp. UT-8R-CII-1-4]MDI6024359.1 TetR/AcrR family transcriptional regulator [Leucobacter sp. UT-8R-CII-1-4]
MDRNPVDARKRGRPTAAERAERLNELLDAAIRLFAARGLSSVTIDDIAAEARVAKRTIYTHFGDRTEIFLASVERLRERTMNQAPSTATLSELAEHIVLALHSDEAVGLHRLMIIEAANQPDLARSFYQEGPEGYIRQIRVRLSAENAALAEPLFSLLLGEAHRKRLLGLAPAPNVEAASKHAKSALATIGLHD